MSAPGANRKALALLAAAGVLLAAVAVAAIYIVHTYLAEPAKVVVIPPKDAAPPAPAARRESAADFTTNNGPEIGGLVVNESGQPIADAQVTLDYWAVPAATQHGPLIYNSAWAQTGHDGRWTSTGVPREMLAHLSFQLRQAKYAFATPAAPSVQALLDHTAGFTMLRGFEISGVVVNGGGVPQFGAKVSAGRNTGPGDFPSTTTDNHGKFTLHHIPPGRQVLLIAGLSGMAPTALDVTNPSAANDVRLVLTAGRTVTGKVTDMRGQGLADVNVSLNMWRDNFHPLDNDATTDAEGNFVLKHLPADDVKIEAEKDGYNGDIADLRADQTALNLHLTGQVSIYGRVTDAQTHAPIQKFTVITGVKWQGNPAPSFSRSTAAEFTAGRYRQTLSGFSGRNRDWYVRIEAPGYLPLVSPAISQPGEQDFQLTPGAGLSGRVVDGGGKPVAGVTVAVVGPNDWVQVNNGEMNSTNVFQVASDTAGIFTLPAQTEKFELLALGPEGFAQVDSDALAKAPDVRLTRWAVVKGRVRIASKPAGDQHVTIALLQPNWVPGVPHIYQSESVQPDAAGNFEFDRVPAGTIQVGRVIEIKTGEGSAMWNQTASESATAVAGQSITVNLGDGGRAVTGRLIIPDALTARKDCLITLAVNGGGRQYSTKVGADGTFRVEDVKPADYSFSGCCWQKGEHGELLPLAQGQRSFSVPPLAGGEGPLAIADIAMTMDKH